MEWMLDSANLNEVRESLEIFPICGVTTNPTILRAEGRIDYAKHLNSLGIPLRVICDSDRKDCDTKVQELESQGITAFKWEDGDALEDAVFRNVSNEAVSRIIRLYDELDKHDSDCERNQIVSEETIQDVRLAIPSFDASWLDGRHEWTIDREIPMFKGEGREYVERFVFVGND